MFANFWLGPNELVVFYREGSYYVAEKFEDWNTVFCGQFDACLNYCKQREIEYYESIY